MGAKITGLYGEFLVSAFSVDRYFPTNSLKFPQVPTKKSPAAGMTKPHNYWPTEERGGNLGAELCKNGDGVEGGVILFLLGICDVIIDFLRDFGRFVSDSACDGFQIGTGCSHERNVCVSESMECERFARQTFAEALKYTISLFIG